MLFSSQLLVEGEDACTLTLGDKVTLINWGNVLIQKIERYEDAYCRRLNFCATMKEH